MSNQIDSGRHPDAGVLSAFVEGVLPEHERLECFAHVAECARCREIVFLSQSDEEAAPTSVPAKKRWYFQTRALSASMAACAAIVILSVYRHQPAETQMGPKVVVESNAPVAKPETPGPVPLAARVSKAGSKSKLHASAQKPKTVSPVTVPSDSVSIAQANQTSASEALPIAKIPQLAAPLVLVPDSSVPPANVPAVNRFLSLKSPANRVDLKPFSSFASVKGAVTDRTGAGISGAAVTLRTAGGTFEILAKTDNSGQFLISGLAAGKYEVRIESLGFARSSSQVELKSNELAEIAASLDVGSTASTVVVMGDAPTPSAEESIRAETLAGKRPFATTVSSGTGTLAVDAAGALYFRQDQTKHWKTVRRKWKGKVTQIVVLTSDAAPMFQLTTDLGEVRVSEDGTHWHREKN